MATITYAPRNLQVLQGTLSDGDAVQFDYLPSERKACEFTLDLTAAGTFMLPEATWLNSQPSGAGHYILKFVYIGDVLYAINATSLSGGSSGGVTSITVNGTLMTGDVSLDLASRDYGIELSGTTLRCSQINAYPGGNIAGWNSNTTLRSFLSKGVAFSIYGNPILTAYPASTSEVTLDAGSFATHTPSTAPTYTLPASAGLDTAVVNRTTLYVDFANVSSIAFVNGSYSGGKEPDIEQGQKWCFLCEYVFSQWIIYPIMIEEVTA